MTSSIKLICFDLGGVLVKLYRGASSDLLAACPTHNRAMLEEYLRDNFIHPQTDFSLSEKYQLGELSTEEYLAMLLPLFEGAVSEEFVRQRKLSIIAGHYDELTGLLPQLSKHYRLGCFSNTHDLHWQYMLEQFEWFNHLEIKLASHLTGIAKPAPKSFEIICDASKLNAAECLFIDDREINIDAARSVGMSVMLCKDPKLVAKELKKLMGEKR